MAATVTTNNSEDNRKIDGDDNNKIGFEPEYQIQCDEINKRSIGKAIIKFCGHEGTENNKNEKVLRSLLQAAISHVGKEQSDVWKNAELRIYDDNFEIYSIKAGHGKNMFMVSQDENDEPKVIKTKHSRVYCSNKQQKCVLF